MKDIIQSCYKEQEKSLSLSYQDQYWDKILTQHDWSFTRHLFLPSCRINDQNAQILGTITLPNLQYLQLTNNKITSKGLLKILKNQWKQWKQLKTLKLDRNPIQNEGFSHLIRHNIQSVKNLHLLQCGLSSLGLRTLLQNPIQNIVCLELSENSIGQAGIKILVKANFPFLQVLDMNNCFIGNEGAKNLSKSKWPNIHFINLGMNYIGLQGFDQMVLNNWKELQKICVGDFHENTGDFAMHGMQSINFVKQQSSAILCCRSISKNYREQIKKILQSKIQQPQELYQLDQSQLEQQDNEGNSSQRMQQN